MSEDWDKIHDAIKTISILRVSASESIPSYIECLGAGVIKSKEILKDPEYDLLVDKFPSSTQKFCYAAVYLLKRLSQSFTGDPVKDLLSASQQTNIRIILQMLFSLGVLPALKPSVNVPLLKATKELKLHLEDYDKWPLQDQNEFLAHAVLELISLLKTPNLRSLILKHLRNLLSALLQIMHCKVNSKASPTSSGSGSREIYPIQQRIQFVRAYEELSEGIYKPLLIKELLILLMPKRDKSVAFPGWLDQAIIRILTGYLTKPGGVAMVIRACCPSNTEEVKWANVLSLAKLISTVHQKVDPDVFYSQISPQVISLLHATGPYCLPVAKMCIKAVLDKDSKRCDQHFFEKLFEPFILCSKPLGDKFNGALISEESISRCIDNISKCFDAGCSESALPVRLLSPIIKIKFNLYMKSTENPYKHSEAVEQLLVRYLADLDTGDFDSFCKVFGALLFDEPHEQMLEMNHELRFEFGPSGGIQVYKFKETPSEQENVLSLDPKMDRAFDSIMALINNGRLSCNGVLFQLFLYLLHSLAMSFETATTDEDYKIEWKRKRQQLFTVKVLVGLSENEMATQFIKHKSHALEVTINTLFKRYLTNSEENQNHQMSLFLPLRLLEIITCDWQPGTEKWKSLEETVDLLRQIIEKCPEDCKEMCNIVYQKLITEGAVKNNANSRGHSHKTKKSNSSNPENDLNSILEMIRTPNVATKGNGLIMLKKNSKKCYLDIMNRRDEIFVLLQECLNDSDSYVYLAAINAFEALTIVYEEQIIWFFSRFFDEPKGNPQMLLKMGEVLTRMARNLGPNSSASQVAVIMSFFEGTKSEDEFIRASCLSNLGEMFKSCRHLCGHFMQRMMVCFQSILATDKSNLARRAVALAGHLVIQGYVQSPTKELQIILLEFYRTMRHAHHTDKDEIVRLHAGAALDELNQYIKDDLTRTLPLEKKISVLSIDH